MNSAVLSSRVHRLCLALVLFGCFGAALASPAPNAWQVADVSNAAGSGSLAYATNLTATQRVAATNNGWRFTVVSRLLEGSGGGAPAQSMVFGNGVRRFYINWDTNTSGGLRASVGGGPPPIDLTPPGEATNAYHVHELAYDPVTKLGTYRFDGREVLSWLGEGQAAQNGVAQWGTSSSGGRGRMNYHRVEFSINGTAVARYDAGLAGSPATPPNPTNQAWTVSVPAVAGAVTNAPVAADARPLPTISGTWDAAGEVPLTGDGFRATGYTVDLALIYAPMTGAELTLVRNTGLRFIQGQFDNLTNGQPVRLVFGGRNYDYVANYYGGDGNDLVLTWANLGVFAWGSGFNGQLGNGSTAVSLVPTTVVRSGVLSNKSVVLIRAARTHSLALCSDGTVAAWGGNSLGQLGDETLNQKLVPVAVTRATGALSNKTVVALAAGTWHSLALCSDGTVAAWGDNSAGQLGIGAPAGTNRPTLVVTNTGALSNKFVVAIAAGEHHSAALCSDGTVATWGANLVGQLGTGTGGGTNRIPVAVLTASGALSNRTVVALSARAYSTAALCSDGAVVTWGHNLSGQLGDGTLNGSATTPVETVAATGILSNKTVIQLAAGQQHSLALCSDGTLASWGYGGRGSLGTGNNLDTNRPVPVHTATGALSNRTVVNLSAAYQSLALCADGTVAVWGLNDNGQLGLGHQVSTNLPVQLSTMSGVLSNRTLTALASGVNHTLALAASPAPLSPTLAACPANVVTNVATGTNTPAVSWTLPTATGDPVPVVRCLPPPGSNFGLGVTTVTCTASNVAGVDTCSFTVTVCARNIEVTSAADGGSGSLRGALAGAWPGGTISFAPALAGSTIVLTNGELVIGTNLSILGPAARNLFIDGRGTSRVFYVSVGATGTLAGLTITNGRPAATDRDGRGGGIYSQGSLLVSNCTILRCSAVNGGGLYQAGVSGQLTVVDSLLNANAATQFGGAIHNNGSPMTVRNCTVSGNSAAVSGAGIFNSGSLAVLESTLNANTATQAGGGIANQAGGVTVQNCTVSGNASGTGGGGIDNSLGSLVVRHSTITGNRGGVGAAGGLYADGTEALTNCIVAGNFIGASPSDIGGTAPAVDGAAYNLVGNAGSAGGITNGVNGNIVGNGGAGTIAMSTILNTNLALNGGATATHALVPGSRAMEAGGGPISVAYDQRGTGFRRVVGGAVDIGSFEYFLAPSITCPANLVTNNTPDRCWATNVTFQPGVTGWPVLTVVCILTNTIITPPHSFNVGTNLVICTASNFAGTATCSFTVIVRDVTPPALVGVPADASYQCLGEVPAPSVVTATDNCDTGLVPSRVSTTNGSCPLTIVHRWTVADRAGNSVTNQQTIIVRDTIAPTLVGVPANTSYACLGEVPAPAGVTATDNCGSPIILLTATTNGLNPITITRSWTATDACTNRATATQTITVRDTNAPVLVCPASFTTNAPAGVGSVLVSYSVSATDNCGGVSTNCVPPSGSAFPLGVTTVTCAAWDAAGNTNRCTFTISVCTSNIVVQNANDSGPGSLRNALAAICPGGAITFTNTLNGQTIRLTSGELVIHANLSVLGPGATNLAISGNGSSRVFQINPGVTSLLSGLTITNGNGVGAFASDEGGGINNRGTLTVSDSTVSGNSATFGGGIINEGLLTVRNCTLKGNSGRSAGGGIYGGGMTTTVIQSTLTGNSAGAGGGIYAIPGALLTVQNSTLSGNSATNAGGGLYNAGGTIIVENVTLSGNSAHSGGGGYNQIGELTVQSSTLNGNVAQDGGGGLYNAIGTIMTVQNSTLSGNGARGGGGIRNDGGELRVQNSTLSGNVALVGAGGLQADGIEWMTNCIVAGNFSPNPGSSDIGGAGVDRALYNLIGNAGLAAINGNIVLGNSLPITSILDTNLAYNGGPTRTHALVPGSPAVNAGTNLAGLPAFDQRGTGFPRVLDGTVDIGAYEYLRVDTVPPVCVSAGMIVTLPGVVVVRFSEAVDPATATNAANYSVPGFSILRARLDAGGGSVILELDRPLALTSAHAVTVQDVRDRSANVIAPNPCVVAFRTPGIVAGLVNHEVYPGIDGPLVSSLVNAPAFPYSPATQDYVPGLELPADPFDLLNVCGSRLYGYVVPPVSGNYHFFLSSDDQGEFWLSTDQDPTNRVLICREPGWSSTRQWTGSDNGSGRNSAAPENQSSTLRPGGIPLEAGRHYFFELLVKEGYGGHNGAVAWQLPGESVPVNGSAPIPVSALAGLAESKGVSLAITSEPQGGTFCVTPTLGGDQINLQMAASVTPVGNPTFLQWQRRPAGGGIYVDLPGATNNFLVVPRDPADNGACYRTLVFTPGAAATSAPACLTILVSNSPPRFIKGADDLVVEDSGPRTVPRWATGITNHSVGVTPVAIASTFDDADGVALAGLAGVNGGVLKLTPPVNNSHGAASFGFTKTTFERLDVTWKSYLGDGVCGADGYSLNLGEDFPADPGYGGEDGMPAGLVVSVDTYDNGSVTDPCGTGIEIRWHGVVLACAAISKDDPGDGRYLRKSAFVNARLSVDATGLVVFNYDDVEISAQLTPYTGLRANRLMFWARTGGCTDNHWIDDLSFVGLPVYPHQYEASQSVHFNVSNNNPTLFAVPPAISPDGTLTYTPAPNACGEATVTVVAQDDGGVNVCGGGDTSAAQTFVISVTCVPETPTLTCPGPITTTNTPGQCSAIVSYTVSADSPVVCAPPSGATFPVGQTTVTCTATNVAGSSMCNFTVTVRDTEPPVMQCPPDRALSTLPGNSTIAVTFTATANDNCSGPTPVTCTPPSGTAFPVGTNVVTCRAADPAGNTNFCSFTLIVTAVPAFVDAPGVNLTGVSDGAVAWGDFTGDGRPDLFLSGETVNEFTRVSQLRRNVGGTNVATVNVSLPGLHRNDAAWADYDLDGDLDLVVSGEGSGPFTQLYRNDGNGVFTAVPTGLPAVLSSTAAWGDFDRDGRPDLLLGGVTAEGEFITRLYRNCGDGQFAALNSGLPGVVLGAAACADFDRDGNLDFALMGFDGAADRAWIYRGQGNGAFTEVSGLGYGFSQGGVAWADYNQDGYPDVLFTGQSGEAARTVLYRNVADGNGGRRFEAVPNSRLPDLKDSGVVWGDFNNDGLPDVAMAGGTPSFTPARFGSVYLNSGNGQFAAATALPAVEQGMLATADFNGDGRLDLVVAGYTGTNRLTRLLLNNNAQTNSRPAAPGNLAASLTTNGIALRWDAPADAQTLVAGLSYNVRVTGPNGRAFVVPPAALADGTRLVPGYGQHAGAGTTWSLGHLAMPTGEYTWSVQAIDSAWAGSAFSTNGTFRVRQPEFTSLGLLPDGRYRMQFRGSNLTYRVEATTTPEDCGLSVWTPLGAPATTGPDEFEFIDAQAPAHSRRFYRLVWP